MSAKGPSKRVKHSVFNRDGWRCRYCGGVESLCPAGHSAAQRADGGWTVDHVMPRSRGGSDKPSNLVTCCHPCNARKGNRTPEEAGMVLLPIPLELHPFAVQTMKEALYSWRPARSDWR